jgi:hypothetical protein
MAADRRRMASRMQPPGREMADVAFERAWPEHASPRRGVARRDARGCPSSSAEPRPLTGASAKVEQALTVAIARLDQRRRIGDTSSELRQSSCMSLIGANAYPVRSSNVAGSGLSCLQRPGDSDMRRTGDDGRIVLGTSTPVIGRWVTLKIEVPSARTTPAGCLEPVTGASPRSARRRRHPCRTGGRRRRASRRPSGDRAQRRRRSIAPHRRRPGRRPPQAPVDEARLRCRGQPPVRRGICASRAHRAEGRAGPLDAAVDLGSEPNVRLAARPGERHRCSVVIEAEGEGSRSRPAAWATAAFSGSRDRRPGHRLEARRVARAVPPRDRRADRVARLVAARHVAVARASARPCPSARRNRALAPRWAATTAPDVHAAIVAAGFAIERL